jgi:hypothetical protein
VEVDDPDGIYVGLHHKRPLVLPGLPLKVEVHAAVKWPRGLTAPAPEELIAAAVPSTVVPGISTLEPAQHALVLAAHAWAHRPLRSVRDLLDVALVAAAVDRASIDRLACAWRVERLWRTTAAAGDALFVGARRPLSVRLFGRHLPAVRERVVLENHLERWLSAGWSLPLPAAARAAGRALRADIVPAPDESWREKAARTAYAFSHPLISTSEHHRAIGPAAFRGQGRNTPGPEDL